MSGGGSNGAWEAGVLWGFLHYGNPKDYKYDVISGVSAGSINTAALSAWKIGDELAASEWLSDNWNNLTTDQIYKDWFGGVAHGIFEAGLYDDSPAIDYLNSILQEFDGYQKRISISSVNANTGEEVVFTESNTAWTDLAQATLSSSSVPGIFPP
jgi:predicted acylesterase/phospholipase RssA